MAVWDAILVLGGGIREGGLLPTWVKARLDRVLQVYSGSYVFMLSAGTTHRPPPLDAAGFPIFESTAGGMYLLNAGIPEERIFTETQSYDTIGNAIFSRLVHVDPQGFRRLLVITSDFHVKRTELTFRWIYGLEPRFCEYYLEFQGVADPSMDQSLRRQRETREAASIEETIGLAKRLTSMRDFHRWLFTEHGAYNLRANASCERSGLGETLQSY